ncbi:hypothetical protein DYH09_03385 [bacterium CPR1]|nr:hypothetical protein [bacterium CPR1]
MEPRQSLGNYRLVREIGRGSMGTVYLAHQESLGRDLAIKVLPAELTREADFLERFKREARIAASLRHPNIIQVFDAAESDGCHYLVMEYLGGRDLRECLQPGVPYGVEATLKLVDQVLSALQHAHEHGVVHRDVKPANVLVAENGMVTLTDFSIAHCRDSVRLTRTGMMVGTPEYMAPEQFEGEGVDARADLYATGVILYEMLTGVQPFRGQTTPEVMKAHLFKRPQPPGELNREVSQAVSQVVMRALEKDREVRYASAGEMREALKQAAGEPAGNALEQFLAAVVSGRVSMDEAIAAHSKVKQAIDQGFRRVLTVMFVDLAGSSKLKTPNQTFHADQAFRAYRSLINGALESNGCLSYDWSGDGAICLFPEPAPAVQAAVQIQQKIAQLNARSQLSGLLLARIGINTGDVYLDPRRSLGEFASRTVDQAGHLEKDCPPGSIYLSQATAQAVSSLCVLEEVGLNRDQVLVYRVQIPDLPPEAGSTQMFCARCGTGMPREARFCPACGLATTSAAGSGGHSASPRPSGSLSGNPQPAPAPLVTSRVQPPVVANSPGVQRAEPSDSASRARPAPGPADSASRSQPILPPPPSESGASAPRPAPPLPQPATATASPSGRPLARFQLWWGWTCYAIFTVALLLGVGLANPVITGTGLIALSCMHLVALGSGVLSLVYRRWMTLAQIVGAFLFFVLLTGAVWNVHQGRMTP